MNGIWESLKSAEHNGFINMTFDVLNWQDSNCIPEAEVLVLSDINYEPQEFESLYQLIKKFILNGSTILLSTPQRLVAKTFISKILPFCNYGEEQTILSGNEHVSISVFVLAKEKSTPNATAISHA